MSDKVHYVGLPAQAPLEKVLGRVLERLAEGCPCCGCCDGDGSYRELVRDVQDIAATANVLWWCVYADGELIPGLWADLASARAFAAREHEAALAAYRDAWGPWNDAVAAGRDPGPRPTFADHGVRVAPRCAS